MFLLQQCCMEEKYLSIHNQNTYVIYLQMLKLTHEKYHIYHTNKCFKILTFYILDVSVAMFETQQNPQFSFQMNSLLTPISTDKLMKVFLGKYE